VRAVALLALAAVVGSCGIASGQLKTSPADLYSIMPSQSDIRSLLGDSTWWAGPPSFEVRPLDAETTPGAQKFAVSQDFRHVGSGEELFARYTLYDKTSSATSAMSDLQTAYGTSPTSPKVGDQVLYYGAGGTGGAPFLTRTFVRVGQVILQLVWARKDRGTTVDMLAKNARKFAAPLKDLSKAHGSLAQVDPKFLPPPGFDITLLGSTQVPVETFVVLSRTSLPDYIQGLMRNGGVTTFPYGDYALNNDTHMEVQTALLTLASDADASAWAKAFGSGDPDPEGIYMGYIPTGGNPAAGVYQFVFAAGRTGVFIVCKASVEGEAASRECEAPVHNTAVAWKIALGG
jgi:hypothetical protein